MTISRTTLLSWLREYTGIKECTRYDDLIDGLIPRAALAQLFPLCFRGGFSPSPWDDIANALSILGVPASVWDPHGVAAGRPKACYNFLVLMYFLHALTMRKTERFTLDFQQPVENNLAMFLQSPQSLECVARGVSSNSNTLSGGGSSGQRGRSKSPPPVGMQNSTVVTASKAPVVPVTPSVPSYHESPPAVSPYNAQPSYTNPTQTYGQNNSHNNTNNNGSSGQALISTLRYALKSVERTAAGLNDDVLTLQQNMKATVERYRGLYEKDRDLLRSQASHIVAVTEEQCQTANQKERAQRMNELQRLMDTVEYHWEVRDSVMMPASTSPVMHSTTMSDLTLTRQRIEGLRTNLQTAQQYSRSIYERIMTLETQCRNLMVPEGETHPLLTEVYERCRKEADDFSHASLQLGGGASNLGALVTDNSLFSGTRVVQKADELKRIQRFIAYTLEEEMRSPAVGHNLLAPLPTMSTSCQNLQYSLATACAVTYSELLAVGPTALTHNYEVLRRIPLLLEKRLAQAQKELEIAQNMSEAQRKESAALCEAQMDLKAVEAEHMEVNHELASARSRWSAQLQNLKQEDLTQLQDAFSRYNDARSNVMQMKAKEEWYSALHDIQSKMMERTGQQDVVASTVVTFPPHLPAPASIAHNLDSEAIDTVLKDATAHVDKRLSSLQQEIQAIRDTIDGIETEAKQTTNDLPRLHGVENEIRGLRLRGEEELLMLAPSCAALLRSAADPRSEEDELRTLLSSSEYTTALQYGMQSQGLTTGTTPLLLSNTNSDAMQRIRDLQRSLLSSSTASNNNATPIMYQQPILQQQQQNSNSAQQTTWPTTSAKLAPTPVSLPTVQPQQQQQQQTTTNTNVDDTQSELEKRMKKIWEKYAPGHSTVALSGANNDN